MLSLHPSNPIGLTLFLIVAGPRLDSEENRQIEMLAIVNVKIDYVHQLEERDIVVVVVKVWNGWILARTLASRGGGLCGRSPARPRVSLDVYLSFFCVLWCFFTRCLKVENMPIIVLERQEGSMYIPCQFLCKKVQDFSNFLRSLNS